MVFRSYDFCDSFWWFWSVLEYLNPNSGLGLYTELTQVQGSRNLPIV
jgi:hypothetical protein